MTKQTDLIVQDKEVLTTLKASMDSASHALMSIQQTLEESLAIADARNVAHHLIKTNKRLVDMITSLAGTKIGFKMDKKDYPLDTVIDCCIEAMMYGLTPSGNKFNILGGNMYITKEGMFDLVNRVTGFGGIYSKNAKIVDFKKNPATNGYGAEVQITDFRYYHNGKLCNYVDPTDPTPLIITVRVNAGQAEDAIFGKVDRKLYALLYKRLTGVEVPEGENDSPNIVIKAVNETPKQSTAAKAIQEISRNKEEFHYDMRS